MQDVTMKSIRGASPSKIVQLFPDLLPEALKLGRWTKKKTFCSHCQAPVDLLQGPPPPVVLKQNLQQLLRHGFEPTPPPHVSSVDNLKPPPECWIAFRFVNLRDKGDFFKVLSFEEGIYVVDVAGTNKGLCHHEWMGALSEFRAR
jgi:hypothetical protein